MPRRPRWCRGQWRSVVAVVTTGVGLSLGPVWAGEELGLAAPSHDGLVAVMTPPEVPAPPPIEHLGSVGGLPSQESPVEEPSVASAVLRDYAAMPLPGLEGESAEVGDRASGEATAPDLAPEAVEPPTVRPPVPSYPVVVNQTVEALIDYFTARDRERERFGLWLGRSGRYLEMIRRVFRERGLPEELAYTAMIESGFSPRAVSRAGAKGLWQFMEATARRYGLVINRWVDERFDPVKSTIAAAQYLGDLHGMFGHWFLAQAAYNAGEARIARAIQLARTSDFWSLTQTRYLPQETKLFVPQILAAMVITREPARYGFEVAVESPLDFDEVTVRQALDLETVAGLAGVPVQEIRELNLALRAGITPPFGAYALRLPAGSGQRFEDALRRTTGLTSWMVHRVGRHQSLAAIARTYRVSPQRLAEVNQLRGGRLPSGVTEMLVPVIRKEPRSAPALRAAQRELEDGLAATGGVAEVVIRQGDTLSVIAARHGTTPQALAQLNGRDLDALIFPGDRLKVHTP